MGVFAGSKQKYTCSKCKGTGHNRRSCGKTANAPAPSNAARHRGADLPQPADTVSSSTPEYGSQYDAFKVSRSNPEVSPQTPDVLERSSMFNPDNPDVVPMEEIEENAAGYIAQVQSHPTAARWIEESEAEDATFEKEYYCYWMDYPRDAYRYVYRGRVGGEGSGDGAPRNASNLSPVSRAFLFSKDAHRGQVDKLGVPYYLHPRGVADCLEHIPEYHALTAEQKEDAKVAAYLHDVLEDTTYTRYDLQALGFRDGAIDAIEAVTAPKRMPKDQYYERVKTAGPVAVAVKLADLSHNNLQSRRAQLPGAPGKPVPAGGQDQFTRLGKKYAKAYKALGSDVPDHLKPFQE